jgi:prepilin peptidase CpaA
MSELMMTILFCILLVALFYDVTSNRIPNLLILVGLILGFGFQHSLSGLHGVAIGSLGLAVGFSTLLPMYVLGGTGAGDVKLMSVVGLFLGGPLNALMAGLFTLIVGGICGLLWIVAKKDTVSLQRYYAMVKCLLLTGHMAYVAPVSSETAALRFPYAIAISMGTLVAWLINL